MSNSVTHDGTTVREGDVLYMTDNIHPVTVLALYQGDQPRAVLGYGGQEYLIDAGTVLSRVKSGSWSTVGQPAYRKGMRFRQPSTDTLVTIQGVSDRQVATGGFLPRFQYFVQHVDANGTISYTTLDERHLDAYERETSVIVRPFPEELPGENVIDGVEIIID